LRKPKSQRKAQTNNQRHQEYIKQKKQGKHYVCAYNQSERKPKFRQRQERQEKQENKSEAKAQQAWEQRTTTKQFIPS